MTDAATEESQAFDNASADLAIGSAIAHLRSEAGMSQQDLSLRMRSLGWKWLQPTVWSIEKGKRPLRLAETVDLAQVFEVPVEQFLQDPLPSGSELVREADGFSSDAAIGRLISERRKDLGATQDSLASAMREHGWPWSQSWVARVELGQESLRVTEARDLAMLLAMPVHELFTTPLEGALRDVEASRLAANRTLRETDDRLIVLELLSRAADGQDVALGPDPETMLIKAFRIPLFPWQKTRELFQFLGVSMEDLQDLDNHVDYTVNETHDPRPVGRLMWKALQKALPSLTTASE